MQFYKEKVMMELKVYNQEKTNLVILKQYLVGIGMDKNARDV